MYSTSHLVVQARWTKGMLLQHITEESVFAKLGLPVEEPIGQRFCSPFRRDSTPDCKLILARESGQLRYYDPAMGLSLDWIALVMYSQGLEYQEALAWIAAAFKLDEHSVGLEATALVALAEQARKRAPQPATIQVRTCPMSKQDLAWWQQFNVSEEALFINRIWAISDYWLNSRHHYCPRGQLAFCYKEEDGVKLYFPEEDKKWKWRSTTKALSCYEQLPQTGNLLVITSSKKDALCLMSFGYHAVAPQGEGMDIHSYTLWELKKRFTKVVIFYDNDYPGLQLAQEKTRKWEVTDFVFLPFTEEQKDPAAYCATYGVVAATNLFHTILTPYAS